MKSIFNKTTWIFAAAMLTLAACGGGSEGALSGKLKNAKGKTVVLEVVENNVPRATDSATVGDDGTFSLKLPYGKRAFYRLKTGSGSMIVLCMDSTEKVTVNADALQLFETYEVKGSEASEKIREFFTTTNKLATQMKAIEDEMRSFNVADTARGIELGKKYNSLTQELGKYVHDFIDKNPASPATYLTIGYLNWQIDMPYFKKVEKALATSMPKSEYHNYLVTQISQIEYQQLQMEQMQKQQETKMNEMRKTLSIGSTPPDINYPNPDGKNIALSSLKGKVVLVDFWASWCRPCRAENPNVVRLYNKYKNKGFTVYSVSLDQEKTAWVNAIAKDGLIWPNHVSELKYWQSSVVKDYGFDGIPFTLLLDKQGKIVDIGLRGDVLAKKLEELLGS